MTGIRVAGRSPTPVVVTLSMAIVLGGLTVACGSGDATGTTDPPSAAEDADDSTTTEGPSPRATDATSVATTASPATTGVAPAASTTSTSTTSTSTTLGPVIPDVAPLVVGTSGSGLGARPVLRWEPVDAAVEYVVVVNDADGGPLWMWQGPTTEVAFGGGPIDDPDTTGAALTGPATWFVAAQGADGAVLAVSAPSMLAP